jgi:hypothetical protein
MTLSAIHIPIMWYQPSIQHSHKNHARTHAIRRKPFFKWTLISIFSLSVTPGTYSLTGTNHAIVIRDTSNYLSRQHVHAQTTVDKTVSAHTDSYALGTDHQANDKTKVDKPLPQTPFCFVADTNSVPCIMDTEVNRHP